MSKRKLKKFAELATFPNVIQLPFSGLTEPDYQVKGRWSSHYFKNNLPVILELGCGKGDYTLALAEKFPKKNFIGIDIKGARLWRGGKTALEKNLLNVVFIRTNIERIRQIFGENEVSEIWLTFPDPYPKKKKEKKRLTSPWFLEMYRQILQPEGIVHLKTDNRPLFEYSATTIQQYGGNLLLCTFDLYKDYPENEFLGIKTFYEKMFLEQGAKICYLKFHFIQGNR